MQGGVALLKGGDSAVDGALGSLLNRLDEVVGRAENEQDDDEEESDRFFIHIFIIQTLRRFMCYFALAILNRAKMPIVSRQKETFRVDAHPSGLAGGLPRQWSQTPPKYLHLGVAREKALCLSKLLVLLLTLLWDCMKTRILYYGRHSGPFELWLVVVLGKEYSMNYNHESIVVCSRFFL